MCKFAPKGGAALRAAAVVLCLGAGVALQAQTAGLRPDWRRVGTSAYEAFLASPAGGPVQRVWFSQDGGRLFVRVSAGRNFESQDLGDWKPSAAAAAPEPDASLSRTVPSTPEPGAIVRAGDVFYARLYAFGRHVYRSDDGGRHWRSLTNYRGRSIIGEGFVDLAVSPSDSDVLAVANQYGVWRSSDGGLSWIGLNETLPNLPVRRLLNTPSGTRGATILLPAGYAYEWAPGEKQSWQPVADSDAARREAVRQSAAARAGSPVTAVALSASRYYAGAADGGIWTSADGGEDWILVRPGAGSPVEALTALPGQPGVVFATFGVGPGREASPRVLRTLDGGVNWEDLTGDLPRGSVHGVAAAPSGAAVYVASDGGVFLRMLEGGSAVPSDRWIPMSESLPAMPALDVALDEQGNQLFVAMDSSGVYAAPAPHRFLSIDVVNSADLSRRPAAPGSLLTVLGGRLVRAQAGLLDAPVLAASEAESQIQVPFEVAGSSAPLALELSRGRLVVNVPLTEVSPAIFVDREGAGLLLDAASGVLLDVRNPARAGSRVQVLATGLGKVTPPWPTGRVAPLREPPGVARKVEAYLDGAPIEVTRATLAPGYIGFYLVEVQLPAVLNGGAGELYLEAAGHASNRVRIDLEP